MLKHDGTIAVQPKSAEIRTARARKAALDRHRAPGDPEIKLAQRDLAAAKIADYTRKILADAATAVTRAA